MAKIGEGTRRLLEMQKKQRRTTKGTARLLAMQRNNIAKSIAKQQNPELKKKNPDDWWHGELWYRYRNEDDTVNYQNFRAVKNARHYGYDMYFVFNDGTKDIWYRFPITPSAINISREGNNETVDLINEGEVNILKSPKLTEVEFDALFPMYDHYPFATTDGQRGTHDKFQWYWDFWNGIMEKRLTFRFVVSRRYGNYSYYKWDTDLKVSLESMELKEDADEYGQDIMISFKLKTVREYGVKVITTQEEPKTTDTSTTDEKRDEDASPAPRNGQWKVYTVVQGDDLKIIAKRFYDDDSEEKRNLLYNVNRDVIEEWAKRFNHDSSSNGHWIFPGEPLVIPWIYDETYGVADDDEISLENLTDDGVADDALLDEALKVISDRQEAAKQKQQEGGVVDDDELNPSDPDGDGIADDE